MAVIAGTSPGRLSRISSDMPQRSRHAGELTRWINQPIVQTAQRATIMDQVEFHVAATTDQLVFALRRSPGLAHPAAHNARECIQEGQAGIADECEIRGCVAAEVMIEEYAAGATRLVPVRQEEV